ncbi:hypothetical protein AX16_010859 [Volvariella volvacea WC 439]|nr:hypothetical protein AX16_010859 [Volvariella volvacea WC 439]
MDANDPKNLKDRKQNLRRATVALEGVCARRAVRANFSTSTKSRSITTPASEIMELPQSVRVVNLYVPQAGRPDLWDSLLEYMKVDGEADFNTLGYPNAADTLPTRDEGHDALMALFGALSSREFKDPVLVSNNDSVRHEVDVNF